LVVLGGEDGTTLKRENQMKNKLCMYVVSPDGHLSDFNITQYNNMVRMMSEKELENHQIFVNEDEANEAIELILLREKINEQVSHLDVFGLQMLSKAIEKWADGVNDVTKPYPNVLESV